MWALLRGTQARDTTEQHRQPAGHEQAAEENRELSAPASALVPARVAAAAGYADAQPIGLE
ncbi:hypothetical protein D3C79_1043740 [compost metagenome]